MLCIRIIPLPANVGGYNVVARREDGTGVAAYYARDLAQAQRVADNYQKTQCE